IADLGGVKLISFLIVMVNVLIAEIIFTNGLLRRVKRGIFIVLIFLVCFLYSVYRLNSLAESDSIKVSVIQPNVLQELKWKPHSNLEIFGILNDLAKKSEEDALVIFPEASWPLIIDEDNFYELERFIRDINRDTVIGAVIEEKGKFYNAALLFDRKAKLIETYRKVKLVPFGEYVPLRKFVSFINVLNSIGDMSRGKDFTRFIFKNKSLSVLICFEDIFPKHVLNFSRDNDFLINITNDAWFKGEPEAGQHLGIMTLRAIENRISIIRSANTGISGWVSFKGEIEKFRKNGKEVFFPGVKSFKVSLNEKRSFYNKYGDLFSLLCAGFLLSVLIRKRG
ncbi:MAG: apolipoprotein N-acyltransferase, partial [Candidatus Omnitrophica bacterium]|nr:apolipoprotein N-acyltransferase [Candidatus Omnitrophota bacterium]